MMIKINYCIQCGTPLKEKKIERKFRKYCDKCGYIHYINPVPIVAVVVNRDSKILIVKRGIEPQKGKWVLPGGFVDDDESPEQAAIRELKEETNLDAEDVKLITLVSAQSEMYGPILMLGYEALNVKGNPHAGDDAVDVKFEKIADINKIAFRTHRQILQKYFQQMDYSLCIKV